MTVQCSAVQCSAVQCSSVQEEDGGQFIVRNERVQTVYNYSAFHLTLCLANMLVQCSAVQCSAVQCSSVQCSARSRYVTMQLTQWFQPTEATIISFTKSWSTVILKVPCSAVQCSAVICSAVQCSAVQHHHLLHQVLVHSHTPSPSPGRALKLHSVNHQVDIRKVPKILMN
jgi:hypothetical protein